MHLAKLVAWAHAGIAPPLARSCRQAVAWHSEGDVRDGVAPDLVNADDLRQAQLATERQRGAWIGWLVLRSWAE